jgi:hypothetical protein
MTFHQRSARALRVLYAICSYHHDLDGRQEHNPGTARQLAHYPSNAESEQKGRRPPTVVPCAHFKLQLVAFHAEANLGISILQAAPTFQFNPLAFVQIFVVLEKV